MPYPIKPKAGKKPLSPPPTPAKAGTSKPAPKVTGSKVESAMAKAPAFLKKIVAKKAAAKGK